MNSERSEEPEDMTLFHGMAEDVDEEDEQPKSQALALVDFSASARLLTQEFGVKTSKPCTHRLVDRAHLWVEATGYFDGR